MCFFIIFRQLVNRQKKSKKKQPVQLTADMLNELNKNHMGGLENYGQEELYNPDDKWTENKNQMKAKVTTTHLYLIELWFMIFSLLQRYSNSIHGSSSNIYDSWRSQRRMDDRHQYYDAQPNYGYKKNTLGYPPPHDPYITEEYDHRYGHHGHPQNAMGLYTYNPRKYNNDYDPDF